MFISIGTTTEQDNPLKNWLVKPELVRFLVIESKAQYCRKMIYAAATLLCHVMVGAVNMAVLVYSVKSGDYHAVLCSFAFHFLTIEAIVSFYFANGCAIYMHKKHRILTHITLQLLSVIFVLGGVILGYATKGFGVSAHHFIGVIACILLLAAASIGPFVKPKKLNVMSTHVIVGLFALLLSSFSLVTAIFKSSFQSHVKLTVVIVITFFVSFYTVLISYYSLDRLIKRI